MGIYYNYTTKYWVYQSDTDAEGCGAIFAAIRF
jgi:hypothetical protein